MPLMSVPTAAMFVLQVNGYSQLYDTIEEKGNVYWLFSIVLFILWLDMAIYWIHRWLHHRLLYAPIHKLHHKVSMPFYCKRHCLHVSF